MRMNIVLVHGAWADGSSWRGVIGRLQQAGHSVTAPQFPLTTLADNVARLRQVLAVQDGSTVVAAHSYGGQIIPPWARTLGTLSLLSTWPALGSTRANPSVPCSVKASRRPRWRISASTIRASRGCHRTPSWPTSPPTWSRQTPTSCTPYSNLWPCLPSTT